MLKNCTHAVAVCIQPSSFHVLFIYIYYLHAHTYVYFREKPLPELIPGFGRGERHSEFQQLGKGGRKIFKEFVFVFGVEFHVLFKVGVGHEHHVRGSVCEWEGDEGHRGESKS